MKHPGLRKNVCFFLKKMRVFSSALVLEFRVQSYKLKEHSIELVIKMCNINRVNRVKNSISKQDFCNLLEIFG